MSATAMLLDADYVHSKRAIRLTLKANGKTFRAYDRLFKPYFYLLARDRTGLEDVSVMDEGKQYKFGKMEEVERVLEGKKTKLFRLEVAHPGLVPLFREAVRGFGEVFESRIPFVRRYLIDKGLVPCGLVKMACRDRMIESIAHVDGVEPFAVNALAFDIETYNPHGLPDAKRDPMIMLSYADAKESKVLSWKKKFSSDFVESLSSEKEVLEEFGRRLREKKVDLLCTYNGDMFDLPYVEGRAKATGAKLRLGRDNSLPKSKRLGVRSVTKIGGRIHFDVYNTVYFLDYIGAVKLQRLTLGKAYEGLLGKTKEDINKSEIFKAWDEGGEALEHLAKYSRSDAVACLELAEYTLPLFVELARVTGSTLFDVSRFSSGQLVEALLLRKAFEREEVAPSKPTQEQIASRMSEPIKGAFVKSPQPGVYDNLVVFDFKSLYPSIIISHNIDPSTLNCSCCENPHVSPQGYRFCKKRKGLIPSMLEEVLATRFAIQKEMKKLDRDSQEYKALYAKQWALKIVANSIGPNEPLVLLSPQNDVVVQSASEFIDERLGNTFIHGTQLGEADGWSAVCFDPSGKTVFKPIKKVMRHEANSLLELSLMSGREVTITKDHSVFTLDENANIVPVAGCELRERMPVLVPKRMPSPDNKVRPIDLLKALAEVPDEETEDVVVTFNLQRPMDVLSTDASVLGRLDGKAIIHSARGMGIDRKCAGKHLRYLERQGFVNVAKSGRALAYTTTRKGMLAAGFLQGFLPKAKYNGNKREHFVRFNDIKRDVRVFQGLPFFRNIKVGALNGFRLPKDLQFNEDVAALIGYFVSEGNARKWLNKTGGSSYRVSITNYDWRVLQKSASAFNLLGFETQFTKKDVTSNTKLAYLVFKHVFKCGENAYSKQVPGLILSAPPEIKTAFLKAYFEGDGNYVSRSKACRFTTVSRKLATTLTLVLNQLGFGATIGRDGRFYRVLVYDDLFGLDAKPRKLTRTFSFIVPRQILRSEIERLGKRQFYHGFRGGFNRKNLAVFKAHYERAFGPSEKLARLALFLDSDLAVDHVKSISEKKAPKYVYDLSVQDDENFVGGFGLVCLHNSSYGTLLYPRFRWFRRECGEAVTAYGRQYIQDTMEKAEKNGFDVLYGDTDSMVLHYGEGGKEKVLEFQKKVNVSLPETMNLELEDFYPRGIFVSKKQGEKGAKKKYAFINEEGRIKIRGFELVRRDWSKIARNTQRQVLEILLKEGDVKKAAELVRKVVAELKEGRVPLEDCVVWTQLRKKVSSYEIKSPEVAAVIHARKNGVNVPEGSLVAYVITREGKSISEKARLQELAKDYDPDYYVNNQVLPAVLKILGALGFDKDSIKLKGMQTGLGNW